MKETGNIRLFAVHKNNRTIIKDQYYDGAFKLSRPVFLEEGSPTYFLIHVGGGYVGGDRYHQEFCLEEDAQLALTTQSATKVYKAEGGPAVQKTDITLKKGSFLTYIQDPLIAYESAQYIQETSVRMEAGAGLLLTDMFTPGWSESQMNFTYDWIRSKMNVFYEGKRLIMDHLHLDPSDQMDSILLMEGYSHFGSLLFIHQKLNSIVIKELEGVLIQAEAETGARIGFSRLPVGGLLLRVLANQTQHLESIFTLCESIFREKVLHKESIFYRKY